MDNIKILFNAPGKDVKSYNDYAEQVWQKVVCFKKKK